MATRCSLLAAVAVLTLAAPAAHGQVVADTTGQGAKKVVISMKNDLRNLVVAQEQHYAANARYATQLSALKYQPTAGNTVKFLVTEPNGWSAQTHNAALKVHCIIFVNLDAGKQPKTAVMKVTGGGGEPVCDKDP